MVRIRSRPLGMRRRCSTPSPGRIRYRPRVWRYRGTRRWWILVIVPSIVCSRCSWFLLGSVTFVVLALACRYRQSRRTSVPFLPLGTFCLFHKENEKRRSRKLRFKARIFKCDKNVISIDGTYLCNFYLLCRVPLCFLIVAVFFPIRLYSRLFSPLFVLPSFG